MLEIVLTLKIGLLGFSLFSIMVNPRLPLLLTPKVIVTRSDECCS